MAAKLMVAMLAVAIGAWTRVESAASDPFPCLVALPSTLTVQQRHFANVLIKDAENVVADDQAQVQITVRRASDAGDACNDSSNIGEQPASCLAVKTKQVPHGTPTAASVKVLSSRVPECFPGESIPVIATVHCRLGAMSTVSNHSLALKCRQARVLLQLDKPVYSAGQRVFVRGYFVDNFLRTLTQKVTLEIRNPSGVLMVLKTVNNGDIADGVIEDDFNLDPEPQFGFWTVSVKPYVMEGYPTLLLPSSTTFEVKDYVLPRFSVEVGLPPSISQLDDFGIAVEVAASYPFNAAVGGLASIKAASVWGNVRKELSLNYTAESLASSSRNGKMFGVAKFTIPTSALWAALGYEAIPFGSCLHIEAGVRDHTSLRRVKGMSSTCFVQHRCQVNASTLDTLLKPGLPYSSQIQLLDHMGDPAVGQAATVEVVQISSDFSSTSQQFNITSDIFGVVHFFLPGGIDMDTRSATVKVSTQCSPKFETKLLRCRTTPTCPGHIGVTSATGHRTRVDRNHLVRVQVSQAPEQSIEIILMAVHNGDILHSSSHELLASRRQLEDLFVYIEPEWAPGFHWVVYHVCAGGAMIADSLYQPVVFHQENNPRFSFLRNNTFFITGRDQRQTLQVSAKRGSTMYMLTVDQSVYFMNSTNRLTRDTLKKFVKPDYSTSCRHRPSCHSSYAFQMAGITGLGATMATEGGHHNPYCQPRQGKMDIEDCCQSGRLAATRYTILICSSRAASYRRTQGAKCGDVFQNCCANYHKPLKSLDRSNHRGSGGHTGEQFSLDTLYERHHFPETIIQTIVMDSSVKQVDFHIPDTITGWTMQGVAVHPSYPLAVASELNFIVHKEFFLEMHLPSFLVHKEQFALRITLHSSRVVPQRFSIYLVGSWQYCSVAGASGRSGNASVMVPGRSSVSLTYIVTPLTTGEIEISAQAIIQGPFAGGSDSDFLTRSIFVKPRGVRLSTQCDSFPIVLSRGAVFEKGFELTLPGDEVPSTSTARITVSGNVLGHLSRLDGLDDMLRMPYGCGEQNMLRFSVNTIITRYLSRTCGQRSHGPALDPLVRRKALKYTREGYQRQMNYRRDDGSFSAFGDKDRSGSTWLTAFVAKSFCAVEPTMRSEIPIDKAVVARAIKWLESRRTFAGAFVEPGEIIDECMKGGSAGYRSADEVDYQLTAYVAIAMFECRHSYPLAVHIAEAAAVYLMRHYSSLDRAYDVALTSYALSLADPSIVDLDTVRSKLQSFASVIDGATCDSSNQRYPAKHGRGCTGVYLETSAYAMLAQLRLGNVAACGQCYVDWFMKWRKDAGGFVSTQDTVMVIQALTEYQCCHVDEDLGQNLSVSFSTHAFQSSQILSNRLEVNQDNVDLQQRVPFVPNFKKGVSVHVNASGEGRATVQYCLQYNAERNEASCNFTISTLLKPNRGCSNTNVTSRDPESCEMQMDVTVSLSAESTVNRTGMVIIEITLISGFTVDVKDLQRIVKEDRIVKRAERKGQIVVIYLDRLIITRAVTVTLRLYRTDLLGLIQPAVIKVYDYYNPGISCHKFYHLPARNPMLSVLCKDRECLCGAGDCMQCPQNGRHRIARSVKHMASLSCSNDYAWRVRVLKVGKFENGWVRVKAQVEARLKRGTRDVNPGDKLSFYRPSHCACPNLEKGASYLVTGPDRGLKLLLDQHTQIEKWSSTRRFCQFQRLLENKPGVCDAVNQGWEEFKQGKDYQDC